MIPRISTRLRDARFLVDSLLVHEHHIRPLFRSFSHTLSVNSNSSGFVDSEFGNPEKVDVDSKGWSSADVVIGKVRCGRNCDEILECLKCDSVCNSIRISPELVDVLLDCFRNDWKSALAVFRWAESRPGYVHTPAACDAIVDILGKMKQMDHMRLLLKEMNEVRMVTLSTVAKAMRRFSGAGQWVEAVSLFDELGTYGLEKNTESMNLLLDTLCKEGKVEQAREVFLNLKSHIAPDASTFNIFIHGWCKANRVDEAMWTIQEMKGYGCQPCVISYNLLIQFHCLKGNVANAYGLLDEMEAKGLHPNMVMYTTIMSSLVKSDRVDEALEIAQRGKSGGCKLDTWFYNCLIHTLGRSGRLQEAIDVFEVEMPVNGVLPDTSTYNSLISMFCHCNQELKALDLLREMETSSCCKPDVQTYYPLLKSCLRIGDVDGLLSRLLDEMVQKHHLCLDRSAYQLLIHGLCRANKSEQAYRLFEEMIGKDIKPQYRTCRLLLEEVKGKNMYTAADRIEEIMKSL